jgi:hypothetical protein
MMRTAGLRTEERINEIPLVAASGRGIAQTIVISVTVGL